MEIVHGWITALDNKTEIDVILLDFDKAFGKIPHKCLLSKLAFYGITLNWSTTGFSRITSYISTIHKGHKNNNNLPYGSLLMTASCVAKSLLKLIATSSSVT